MKTVTDTANDAPETTDAVDEQTTLLDEASPDLKAGEFYLMEGVKGSGDVPEWYLADKYKSVSEQAKGYSELQKKLGGFTGSPKDGYSLGDGIDAEDELTKQYVEFATGINMNQDSFDKGFDLLMAQTGVNHDFSVEQELTKLGDNAQGRIKTVETFLKNNLSPESYEEVRFSVNNADSIKLVESLINATAPKKLPSEGGENPTGITKDDILLAQSKKDANGNLLRSVDSAYDKKIRDMWTEYAG